MTRTVDSLIAAPTHAAVPETETSAIPDQVVIALTPDQAECVKGLIYGYLGSATDPTQRNFADTVADQFEQALAEA